MGHLSISAMVSAVILIVYYFLLVSVSADNLDTVKSHSAPSPPRSLNYKRFLRSSIGASSIGSSQRVLSHSKIPIELDLLLDDDEMYDKSKRYDDYGHMRFGKRAGGEEQFDDYGHMRFGKRGDF